MGRVSWLFREPDRDPRLGEALRQLEAAPPSGDADRLRRRITAAARTRLVAVRTPAPRWWEWIDRWIPVAVPVGLAVSVAGALLLPSRGELMLSQSASAELVADSALVTAAFSDQLGGELAAGLIAPGGDEWILEQAVTQ
jgi:hypothetical protein